ncbi:hypothetical protein [Cryobacterium sp. Y29]|uniref:hypothetical protein n=1 Tax=Cryobacterium sp. Y29 TaxID=2048285 RepID=UPI000CE4BEAA|nr:hypothetical protein [Cryobacterium sp. Y29]
MATEIPNVIVGVDTHSDTHYVAIIDEQGKHLAAEEFLAVGSGYRKILAFITASVWSLAWALKEPAVMGPN